MGKISRLVSSLRTSQLGAKRDVVNNIRSFPPLRTQTKILSAYLLCLLVGGCLPMSVKVGRYSGDGAIRACSTILAQGYTIDFPPFYPRRPFTASYKMSSLPDVGRQPYLRLAFHASSTIDQLKEQTKGALFVKITDVKGRQLQTIQMSLATAMWGSSGADFFSIGDFNKCRLRVESGETYRLSISYVPESFPSSVKDVFLSIENCAFY